MNLKTLITSLTLALGTSSAAIANPVLSFSGKATVSVGSGPIVRDHRVADDCGDAPISPPVYHQPVWHEPFFRPTNTRVSADASVYTGAFGRGVMTLRARGWFQLTEATRIDGGREFFNLKQEGGMFSKLALKNLGGKTEITQVAIEYKQDGRVYVQKVRFDALLSGQTSLTINLDHDSRAIQRVIVYGASGNGSAYQLLAL